ncbi:MAG TPA: TonB-dependent receptor [Rhodanobacteraceae bacterium]|jgi:outer membrane receptor protein involved in Fe transport|nr:TonB-dependent receptor [Rhodanobacteraceae bacterium]
MGSAAGAFVAAPALAQNQGGASSTQPKTLQTVVVTGSHIRRVDLETSNPVIAVTAQQIQQSGKLTLGEVVQQLPALIGEGVNPHDNNGAGSGATLVGLRGLGPQRTLVLVDGHRVISKDLNSIPAAAVERVEVLTDGASAIYGSDAIGGVINIILKENYQGAQFSLNYGISDHDDGERKGASFVFGQTSDKGSILAGVDYNKFDAVQQSARKFSENALSIAGSTDTPVHSFIGGSSYASRDHIVVPSSLSQKFGCASGGALSLNPAAANSGSSPTSASDYHCYSPELGDNYNYASSQLLQTPQERTSAFFKGVYHLSDNIDAYATVYRNDTTSEFVLAPQTFGTFLGASISKDSMYNPFGVDFNPTNGNVYQSRLVPAGNRIFHQNTKTDEGIFGLRGHVTLFNQDWTWDIGYDYGHVSGTATTLGLVNLTAVEPGLGPSMLVNGVPTCVSTPGDPHSAIAGCTPWDPFNLFSSSATTALSANTQAALNDSWSIERVKHVDVSGGIFNLPAGTAQLAMGASWRDEYSNNAIDADLLIDPATDTCALGSACSSHLQGGYSVKEAYAELFIPVLKDLPFAQALNITLGDRFSKYSTFGSTNNWKAAVEYRPIADLMLRGTVSTVFRAPTISDVFAPPGVGATALSADPCDHITVANPACAGVPLDGSFVDNEVGLDVTQVVGSGSKFAGFPLGPELGKSFDFGAVYSPHFAPGLSAGVDLWRIYLDNVITGVGAQTILNLCFAGVEEYCPLITRFGAGTAGAGQIARILTPTANLGRIDVKGVDLTASYRLPAFSFGQFIVDLSATYLSQYKIQTSPGESGNQVLNGVGEMGSIGSPLTSSCPFSGGQVCFFPRIRGQAALDWQLGPWDASWRMRYISGFNLGSPDPSQGFSAAPGFAADNPLVLRYGATVYSDVTVGYNIEPINTRLEVGVDNVFDKQPPLLYNNNAPQANTDPNDFDVMGRYYWGRVTVKF